MMEIWISVLVAGVVAGGLMIVTRKFFESIKNVRNEMNSLQKQQKAIVKSLDYVVELQKRLEYHQQKYNIDLYRQLYAARDIEALVGHGHVRNLRGWALSPDALLIVMHYIEKYKPSTILELGSGYSTVVIAEFIRSHKLPTKIISVDHSEHFFEQTKLQVHSNVVTLVKAPLVRYGKYSWYDAKKIKDALLSTNKKADLIIVDGPPEAINPQARKPLLDKISDVIAGEYTIILDDAARQGEKTAVKAWLKADTRLTHEFIATEKGLSVLSTKAIHPSSLL